jgi:hypothetical protein
MPKLFGFRFGKNKPAGTAAPAAAAAAAAPAPAPAPALSLEEEIAALEPIVNKTKQEKKQLEAEAAALVAQQQNLSNALGQSWTMQPQMSELEAELALLELEGQGPKGRRRRSTRKGRKVHKRKSRKQRNYGTRRRF